jgi:hypothetical protein
VASGTPAPDFHRVAQPWLEEYAALRDRPSPVPRSDVPRTFIGSLPRPALRRFARTILHPLPRHPEPLLGENFDWQHWTATPLPPPSDPQLASVIALAYRELDAGRGSTAVAIARLIRERAPREPTVLQLLSNNAGWRRYDEVVGPLLEHHLAMAEAYRLLGDDAKALIHDREARQHDI